MRRPLVAAACLVALVVGVPTTASADTPQAATCASGGDRVSVPAGLALPVCVHDGRLVLTNGSGVPVLVRATGDVGAPVLLDPVGDATAAILRASAPQGQVLMPGEAASWPLGAGEGRLEVAPLPTAALARSLAAGLPRDSGTVPAALGTVVDLVGEALDEGRTCQDGGNFLTVAGCDVSTATAIGQALRDNVSWRVASTVGDVLLDPGAWRTWTRPADAAGQAIPAGEAVTVAPVPAPPPPVPAASAATPPGPARHPASTAGGGALAPQAPSVPVPSAPPAPSPRPPAPSPLQTLLEKVQQWLAQHGGRPAPPRHGGGPGR